MRTDLLVFTLRRVSIASSLSAQTFPDLSNVFAGIAIRRHSRAFLVLFIFCLGFRSTTSVDRRGRTEIGILEDTKVEGKLRRFQVLRSIVRKIRGLKLLLFRGFEYPDLSLVIRLSNGFYVPSWRTKFGGANEL